MRLIPEISICFHILNENFFVRKYFNIFQCKILLYLEKFIETLLKKWRIYLKKYKFLNEFLFKIPLPDRHLLQDKIIIFSYEINIPTMRRLKNIRTEKIYFHLTNRSINLLFWFIPRNCLFIFEKSHANACLFVTPNIIKSRCQRVAISNSIYFCFILFPSYEFFSNSHTCCIESWLFICSNKSWKMKKKYAWYYRCPFSFELFE